MTRTVEDFALDRIIARYERIPSTESERRSRAGDERRSEQEPTHEEVSHDDEIILDDLHAAAEGDSQEAATARALPHHASTTDSFLLHKVTPADTLGGLELRYGVCASAIRRANGMTSDRLTSHLVLKVPRVATRSRQATRLAPTLVTDARTERMQILRLFRARFPGIIDKEVDFYLASNNADVGSALRACQRDHDWERSSAARAIRARLRLKQAEDAADAAAAESGSPIRAPSRGATAAAGAWGAVAAWFGLGSFSKNSKKRQQGMDVKTEKQLQMVGLNPAADMMLDEDLATSLLSSDFAALRT